MGKGWEGSGSAGEPLLTSQPVRGLHLSHCFRNNVTSADCSFDKLADESPWGYAGFGEGEVNWHQGSLTNQE